MGYPTTPVHEQFTRDAIRAYVLDEPQTAPVPMEWIYTGRNPCMMTVILDWSSNKPASWLVDRELFATGIEQPAGLGNVRFWPLDKKSERFGDLVAMELLSSDGGITFELPTRWMRPFLWRTHNIVRRGRESEYVQSALDAAIGRMLLEGQG